MTQQTLITAAIALVICNVKLINTESDNPVVKTTLGDVRGSILSTVLGKPIYSFRGIRYAKPPVGDLRFQPPVPVEKWSDIYDATQDGPMCPQVDLTPVSEDCLFVNVYTTKLPENGENPKRPVIIFIHFGGFFAYSGSSVWIGPQYLLDEDVVFVTMNYRLGTLGFLSTGDQLAPGNNGLKDQVLAIKWVKDNIAAFGGDPDLVTLSGASAGGISVTLHLISPMSKGLFHRAMARSGSDLGVLPLKTHQFDVAQKQASLLGCPNDTSENIINCLKTKSAKEITDSMSGFQEFGNDPLVIWQPVIERDFGQERFLPNSAVELAFCGQPANVPFVTGISTKEFGFLSYFLNDALLQELDKNFETLAPISYGFERNSNYTKCISKELRKFYLGDAPLTQNSLPEIGKLYADGVIAFSVNRAAEIIASKNTERVYYYLFSYQGPYSFFYKPGTKTPDGVAHLDDLIYLFHSSPLFPRFKVDDPEYAIVKKMTAMYANFARTGKPIPAPTKELDNTPWEPFTVEHKQYLDIGEKMVMKENLYEDRYALWRKLFSLPICAR